MILKTLELETMHGWGIAERIQLFSDDVLRVPTVFTKNRDRLLTGDIAEAFFQQVLALAERHQLLSHDHFAVDGTLLEAWASHKSFRPIDEPGRPPSDDDPSNPSVNFRGEKRSNATHRSVRERQ